MNRHLIVASIIGAMLLSNGIDCLSQQRAGEVAGFLSFVAHKYSGEFTDDSWGFGGFASLQYAPMRRLLLEGRVGIGEIKWGITPTDIQRYPDYFGQNAAIGDNYPGTTTKIESGNESRITTLDLLMHYVIVDRIAAVPFISVGIGLVNFSPANSDQHEPLPNNLAELYSTSAFSIPVGGGVRIPFSDRVGLLLRAEHRFVFTQYLDDISKNGSNDGITSVSVGLTYAFTPGVSRHKRYRHNPCMDCPDEYEDSQSNLHPHEWDAEQEPADKEKNATIDGTMSPKGDSAVGAGADSTAKATPDSTAKAKADSLKPVTPGTGKTPQQKSQDTTQKPVTPKSQVEIKPCPPGTERICVTDDESVCANKIIPGNERIKWEDAFVYEPGNAFHKQTVRQTEQQAPCFETVVRQTANSYYLCVDCCFERTNVGGTVQYKTLGDAVVVKGQGTFSPDDCPDCNKVVESGK